jgi:hypothetical protein
MSPAVALAFFLTLPAPTPSEIVQRSVANTTRDWNAAPGFNFTEHDIIGKNGAKTVKTYQVLMIDGSTYNKLIAIDNKPLPPAQASAEERKLQEETARRNHESPAARQKRVAEYQRERRQDHALLSQMAKAFDYKLEGEETVAGRRCFVLAATPKPSYQPVSRDTKVLKGMRGRLWIDEQDYQWVKVHAQVFRPVAFGLFIAHVYPGTEFTLEQRPVQGNLWLPSHFSMRVNSRILVFAHNSSDDETYSNYRPAK